MSIAERRQYQREVRHLLAEADDLPLEDRHCRECGCSDEIGCEDGCWWVESDLCSLCAEELVEDDVDDGSDGIAYG